MLFVHVLVALFASMMLWRHGPRALLFIAPRSIRVAGDAGAPPRASGQLFAGELLEPIGFTRLGIRTERGPLGGLRMDVDAWAHPDGTCADAYPVGGSDAVIAFLTTFADGYQLGTSNFRRAAVERKTGRVGGLPGASLAGALAAHRKAVESLAADHGAPAGVADLDARLALARRFYAGIGAVELRRPAFMSLLNSVVALMLLASSVRLALRVLGVLG